MQVAVDISLYPLTPDYDRAVKDFIRELRDQPGVQLAVNPLSTQLTGDYDAVMDGLKTAMRPVLAGTTTASFVLKVLNVRIEPGRRVNIDD